VIDIAWRLHSNRDYEISSDGLVRRVTPKRGAKVGRVLRAATTPSGYSIVNVSGKMKFVHVLVLEAFVGPRPDGAEARHNNDVKSDNRVANLCWGTHSENYVDRVRNGGGNHGSRHGLAKLTEAAVVAIRSAYASGNVTHKELGAQFGVSREAVGLVTRGDRWRHV
jgi:hypothetical protein